MSRPIPTTLRLPVELHDHARRLTHKLRGPVDRPTMAAVIREAIKRGLDDLDRQYAASITGTSDNP